MAISAKTITLGGRTVSIEGSSTDPYFQSIEAFAAQTAPLGRFVAEHVDDGLIIDVGGNIGLTAMAMSFAAPGSRIIAFEPSPDNVALFESNTRGQTRIELERCGLADCTGDLDFLVPLAGANCHVVTPNYEFSSSVGFHPLKVPVTTLDSYLEAMKPNERVVLIKIDVEGFEPNVLAGARRVIQRQRPLIWMEFNSVTLNIAQGYSPMAFATALFDCFEVLRMNADGALIPVTGPSVLVHDNITVHGSIEDVVLRARPEHTIPTSVTTIALRFAPTFSACGCHRMRGNRSRARSSTGARAAKTIRAAPGRLCYFRWVRWRVTLRRIQPMPSKPTPSSATVCGQITLVSAQSSPVQGGVRPCARARLRTGFVPNRNETSVTSGADEAPI
jgi:FkbM family methyltransferase